MIVYVFVFILGVVIGSFLNVCIYRLPIGQSIAFTRSRCMFCHHLLSVKDLIPIISYISLNGRCRFCGAHFSARYIIIEILGAILFGWSYLVYNYTVSSLSAFVMTSFLIVIAFIDYDYQLILDKILIWFAGTGLIINVITDKVATFDMVIASLTGGGILLIIAILTKGGMGGGDIKFVAALGLWLGLKLTLLTIFLSFIIGGTGSLLLLAFKIKSRKDFIPFGPFISIAAFISMLYGTEIISWYLQTIVK